jgi:hypothetical protein
VRLDGGDRDGRGVPRPVAAFVVRRHLNCRGGSNSARWPFALRAEDFTTKRKPVVANRIRTVAGGVEVEISAAVKITRVTVSAVETGGDGNPPNASSSGQGGNNFKGIVKLKYRQQGLVRLTVIADLENDENVIAHTSSSPKFEEWVDLELEDSGPIGDMGCGPTGCSPASP